MAKQKTSPTEMQEAPPEAATVENLPVPAEQADSPSLRPQKGAPRLTWFSWPVEPSAGEMINATVRLNAHKKLRDMIGQTICVNRVVSYKEDIPDEETGEFKRLQAIVLLGPGGEGYKCHSVGVAGAVRELLLSLTDAPWNPPLILRVVDRPTRGKKKCLWLDLVGRGTETPQENSNGQAPSVG